MRRFLVLLSRELKNFFYSPVAYVVMFFFLLAIGLSFYISISLLNRGAQDVSVVEAFFNTVPFWMAFLFVFPLITMRVFSEEFKMGTIEPLMTAPVRDWQVVLSKFFAVLGFYVILWLPSAAYFAVFEWITHYPAAQSRAAYGGTCLLLLLMGMFYISVGCFASVLTRNQIVAAVISFSANIILLFTGLLSYFVLHVTPAMRDFVGYFSAIEHMSVFSKGIIDTRPIVFYCTMTILMLAITHQVFQSRKWRV
jgi:ABC-2 type transport system permease protein